MEGRRFRDSVLEGERVLRTLLWVEQGKNGLKPRTNSYKMDGD
jgi:hypothetical protein